MSFSGRAIVRGRQRENVFNFVLSILGNQCPASWSSPEWRDGLGNHLLI
jgi:hypothetical protein